MSVRAAFYQPGATTPYAQVYRPTSQPPEGVPVIMGGTLTKVRPNLPDTGTLVLSAPLAFTPGDWVRVWLEPELPEPDYLGQIVSEPWADGSGEVQMRSIMERVKACRWIGKAEGDYQAFFGAVLSLSRLPPGVTPAPLPAINARFAADTPHELLGDTIQAITPALGGYQIGVDVRGQLATVQPRRDVTHRFMLGQSEMPQGDMTNYANCVRFSFELPSGDTGWFEGRNEPEVAAQGEVWTVEQLTAREVGLPEEPLKGMEVEVRQGWRIGGQRLAELTATVPIERLGTPIAKNVDGQTVYSSTPELGYVTPAAGYVPVQLDSPPTIEQLKVAAKNFWLDMARRLRFDVSSDVEHAVQNIRTWFLERGSDVGAGTIRAQIEVRLKLRYTRLGSNDDPLTALTVQQLGRDGTVEFYSGPEYIDVLETAADYVVVGIKINPAGLSAAPVTEVPVEGENAENVGTSEPTSTPAPPPTPDVYRLAVGYKASYRDAVIAAGLALETIQLLAGGEVGGRAVLAGMSPELLFYPPVMPGKHYLHVAAPDIALNDALIELPLPLPVPDKTALAYAQQLTAKTGATLVTLPAPVALPVGSAILASLPAGATLGGMHVLSEPLSIAQSAAVMGMRVSVGPDGKASIILSEAEATHLYVTSNKLGRALPTASDAPEEQIRFAVRGEDVTARVLLFSGINDLTFTEEQGLSVQTPQLDNVQTYAAELLRYRSQSVRDWRGVYSTLKRLDADGTAAFERPHSPNDELLDVQRVTYNLTDWTAEVQAGTPLPATDEDAVAGVIESVRRVQRRAGGTT